VQIALGTVSLVMNVEPTNIGGKCVNIYTIADETQMPRFCNMAEHLCTNHSKDVSSKTKRKNPTEKKKKNRTGERKKKKN
jgi:hypothetical protein